MRKTEIFMLSALCLSLLSVWACSDDASSGSSSDGDTDSDTDGDTDGDSDSDTDATPDASCMDLAVHLSAECGIPDDQATSLVAGCAMISGSFSQDAMGPLLGCLVAEDCAVWTDQTQSMTAFTACAGEVAEDLPPSAAAEEFVAANCDYQAACQDIDPAVCVDAAAAEGGAIMAILDESALEEMAACVPASPDCSTAEQETMGTCIEDSFPLSMLSQL